jgi:hypothetical protein
MRKNIAVTWFAVLVAMAFPVYALPSEGGYGSGGGRAYVGGFQYYGAELDIGFCYNYLGGFGSWVSMDPYGYVWRPRHMGRHWRPYSEGHWVRTDYGWTWISDEDWGWVAVHYGRWGWDDDIGWFWVPGTVWAPAWVTWRYNDQYCGWAPLPPGVEFSAGIGFGALSVNIPGRFWVFVQTSHFLDPDVRSRVLPYERNTTIINYTTVHNNIYVRDNRIVNDGIGVDEVRRFTGRDVPRYTLRDAGQPGRARLSGREVQIYRPALRDNPAAKPSAIQNAENARRELAPANAYKPEHQEQPPQVKAEVARRQSEEKSLLRKTQSQELKRMQRQQSEEMKHAQNHSEKAKVKREYDSRTSELQKSHQAEKQQMAERHQRETEQLKGGHPTKQGRSPEQARQKQPAERAGNSKSPGR